MQKQKPDGTSWESGLNVRTRVSLRGCLDAWTLMRGCQLVRVSIAWWVVWDERRKMNCGQSLVGTWARSEWIGAVFNNPKRVTPGSSSYC